MNYTNTGNTRFMSTV